MSKKIKNIFSDTACPSQEVMLKYTSNLMKGEEKHVFERHLAGCDFCSDALEGLSLLGNNEAIEDIFALNKKIDNRSKPNRRIGYFPFTVAASVSLLLVTGTWFYLNNEKKETVAMEADEQKQDLVSDKAMSHDSVSNNIITGDTTRNQLAVKDYKEEKDISTISTTISTTIPSIQFQSDMKVTEEEREPALSPLKQEAGEHYNRNANSGADYEISPAPPVLSSVMYESKADKESEMNNNLSREMIAMVEDGLRSVSPVADEKKLKNSKERISAPAFRLDAMKDKSLDDCPDCPKKKVSESAQSNLVILSMDYAMKKYQMKEYELAHKQFEEIIKEDKNSMQTDNAKIYNVLSLINLNRNDEALKLLDGMVSGHTGNNTDAAKWMKASVLIDRGENIQAKMILEDLSKYANQYKSKAKEILAGLK